MTETETLSPHSLDAEKGVLGALLVEGGRFLDIAHRVADVDFFRDAHRRIFLTIREMAEGGAHIDDLTVKERLIARGELDDVGGPGYLFALTDGMPRGFNVEAYADIVRELADKRRLIVAANQILDDAQRSSDEARALIDRAERTIFTLSQQNRRGDFVSAAEMVRLGVPAIEKLHETKQGVTGVPTGFHDFDAMTRGLQPGALTLVAARPSMGKTAWALNAAYHAAREGFSVGFFSLEMALEELFMRLVASVSRVDSHRLQSGYVNQSEFGRMGEAFAQIAGTRLFIDDTPGVGMLDIRGKARRLKAKHGLDLIVLDYLQLMQLGARSENRNVAVAEVSRGLKLVARELEIPVMALSQLSRATEQRGGDKKPMLSDLRDSGALEQDADLVVFIHRAEVYQPTPDNAGLAELIIAKQRNGKTGTIQLHWSKAETRFDNASSR